jgi:hypothetical protein
VDVHEKFTGPDFEGRSGPSSMVREHRPPVRSEEPDEVEMLKLKQVQFGASVHLQTISKFFEISQNNALLAAADDGHER